MDHYTKQRLWVLFPAAGSLALLMVLFWLLFYDASRQVAGQCPVPVINVYNSCGCEPSAKKPAVIRKRPVKAPPVGLTQPQPTPTPEAPCPTFPGETPIQPNLPEPKKLEPPTTPAPQAFVPPYWNGDSQAPNKPTAAGSYRVPEPSSWVLVGVGASLLLGWRRK